MIKENSKFGMVFNDFYLPPRKKSKQLIIKLLSLNRYNLSLYTFWRFSV